MADSKSARCKNAEALNAGTEERVDLMNTIESHRDNKVLRPYIELRKKIGHRILRQPGVVAIDVGYLVRQSQQKFENELAIRIHVQTKLDARHLCRQGLINFSDREQLERLTGEEVSDTPPEENARKEITLPTEGGRGTQTRESIVEGDFPTESGDGEEDGKIPAPKRLYINRIPIDIVEANYFPAQIQIRQPTPGVEISKRDLLDTARSRVEPLVGGISIGNSRGPAGTLGAVVWDRTDGTACVLSNWHVLAGRPSAGVGEPCFQPALFDGGQPSDQIATLKRWIFDRHGDAALAEIIGNRHFCSGETLGLWHPINGSIEPWLGLKVRKWSRTTGFTKGFIDGINLATNIDYGNGTILHLEDQLHVAPRYQGQEFSDRGDSGALLLARFYPADKHGNSFDVIREVAVSNEIAVAFENAGDADERRLLRVYYAVGLLFAGDVPGSQFGEFALATSIKRLEEKLQFSFQPVFVPRSAIVPQQRDLLSQLIRENVIRSGVLSSAQLAPGALAQDTRTGGPQPTPEPDNGGG